MESGLIYFRIDKVIAMNCEVMIGKTTGTPKVSTLSQSIHI